MGLSLDRIEDARAVLIAGPTGSGKSALAAEVAEASLRAGRKVVIVNADSMQVYDAFRILTARPTLAEEASLPHRLYGHVPAEVRYSAGGWLRDLGPALAEIESTGALPMIVGGTGLYFSALTKGLSAVPPIPAEIRQRWSERLAEAGLPALFDELSRRDPGAAAGIRPSDPQRILRALEVLEATGRSVREWQRSPAGAPPLPPRDTLRLVLEPERAVLYARIEARFDRMLEAGALDEVRRFLDRKLPPDLPAAKAIGVKLLGAYLRGQLSLGEAIAGSKQETRHYAKRQLTWFRHQMPDWERLAE
jgi:tRNA dimethylallyltransferase